MPVFRISDAARLLGISDDTCAGGPMPVGSRPVFWPGHQGHWDKVMAQVDIQAGPYRIVSLMSVEAVDDLRLEPGMLAVASVKSTNVILTPTPIPTQAEIASDSNAARSVTKS